MYGLLHAKTMADYKAVSMNLMHEDVKITDSTYAPLLGNEVKNRIVSLNSVARSNSPEDNWAEMLAQLPSSEISKLIHSAVERLAA